jgi:HEAT repeat protein
MDPGIELVDVTIESGIEFSHRQGGKTLTAINDVIGSGACAADYDLDGYLDIYVVNGSGYSHYYGKKWWWSKPSHNVLYRNMGNGRFKDVSEIAGVGKSGWGMGCSFADYDNDGYPDLYVTNFGVNYLFHNNGDGTFADVTDEAGVGHKGWSTAASWADYDLDGDLDLYVVNYVAFEKTMTPAEPNSAFKIVKPLLMSSNLFDSQSNVLYQNNGDGTFVDVTMSAGVGNSPGRGMGAVFLDYDDDGFQDIYVVNDRSRNVLFHNMGDGTFTEVGGAMGVDSPLSGMGVTLGDYDNDGDFDIFSTYAQSETNILYQNLLADGSARGGNRPGFINATVDAGLGEDVSVGYQGWSAEFVDIDNDGYQDIFVANGHTAVDFDNPQTTVAQRNQVFRNNKDGTFTDISAQLGKGLRSLGSSRGMTVGDFDNDGDYDFFINNNNARSQFLENRNTTGNHWINITLRGTRSNRDGIGAKITLFVSGMKQMRTVTAGSGYLSQVDKRVLFGLGDASEVDLIEVRWPSGLKQSFHHIKGEGFITIVEGTDKVFRDSGRSKSFRFNTMAEGRKRRVREEGRSRPDKLVERAWGAAKGTGYIEKNSALLIEAVNALSRFSDERSLKVLLSLLENEHDEVRLAVVRALGDTGRAEVVSPLLILMKKEKRWAVRKEVVRALGKLPPDRSLEPLLEALSYGDVDLRRVASLGLSELFEKEEKIFKSSMLSKRTAVATLIKALDDPDITVRRLVLKSLGLSESYRAVLPVIKAFGDSSPEVSREAVRSAGLLRDRRAIKPLLKILNNEDVNVGVRSMSVISLERLDSAKALEPLFKAVGSGNSTSRLKAVLVFYDLLRNEESILVKKSDIVPALEEAMNDESPKVRKAVMKTAGLLKDYVSSVLIIKGLEDKDLGVRAEAIRTALATNRGKTVSLVKAMAEGRDKEIRIGAMRAFAMLPVAPGDTAYLISVVNDEVNDDVRFAALDSLIKIDSDTAVKVITDVIEKENPHNRRRLIEKLGEAGNPMAVELLIGRTDREWSVEEQMGAVRSLGRFLGDRVVYSTLLRIFLDGHRGLENRKVAMRILLEWSKNHNEMGKLIPFLTKVVQDRRDPVRADVIESIRGGGARKMALILLGIVKDDSETIEIRKTSLKSLISMAPEEAFLAAKELLFRSKTKVRLAG